MQSISGYHERVETIYILLKEPHHLSPESTTI